MVLYVYNYIIIHTFYIYSYTCVCIAVQQDNKCLTSYLSGNLIHDF